MDPALYDSALVGGGIALLLTTSVLGIAWQFARSASSARPLSDFSPAVPEATAEKAPPKAASVQEKATGSTSEQKREHKSVHEGLEKTRKGLMGRVNNLLKGDLDEELADDLEATLVTSDIGIQTTKALLSELRGKLSRKEIRDAEVVHETLRTRIAEIVSRPAPPMTASKKPLVLMVIGVNGVGKTTTIGKLASKWGSEGKKVVLGAGDTFRAAAVEQLEVWAERANAELVKGAAEADPSSVAYEAIQRAKQINADVVICDTAGRLHTKVNLMEELKKMKRVMAKALEGAPHEILMVLDATTGQNAITQAKQFKEAVDINSIALTKLDGTAKGGVVVAICAELGIPVRFIGIGEQIADLRDFEPEEFVEALFGPYPS